MFIFDWLKNYFSKDANKELNELQIDLNNAYFLYDSESHKNINNLKKISGLKTIIKTLRTQILLLNQPINLYKPQLYIVSQSKIKSNILKHFINIRFVWNDEIYKTVSLSSLKRIIDEDKTDLLKYIKETFDCENFAELFKSRMALNYGINAVGQVMNYSGGHAFNIIICTDGVFILEPQSDKLYSAPFDKLSKAYLVSGSTVDI